MKENGIGTVKIIGIVVIVVVIGAIAMLSMQSSGKETLELSGSTTVRPLASKWAEKYMQSNPDKRISVKGGGSGQGVADVKTGKSDIGMSSSESLVDEEPDLVKHVMAYDGIIIVVNKDFPGLNSLMQEGISKSTLQKIYREEIKNWNEVPGISEDHELNAYRRSEASGTAETFASFLGMTQDELGGTGQKGNSGIKQAVEQNKYSLGFIGAAYAFKGKIEEVPIDGNNDGTLENPEKIEDYEDLKTNIDEYPIKRGLYFATKGEPKGFAKTFLEWCKSEGQQYVGEVGYIPTSGG